MYVYRALNNLDIIVDPYKNGLYAKNVLYNIVKDRFDLVYSLIQNDPMYSEAKKIKSKDILNSFNHEELKNFISKDDLYYMNEYQKRNNFDMSNMCDIEKLQTIFSVLATVNSHILNGSEYFNTPWISFTKDFDKLFNYYLSQEIHEVAVIDSNVDELFDNNLLALDLSSQDKIEGIKKYLVKKDKYSKYAFTDLYSRVFNYSKSAKEIIYYNHIPKERIVSILKPLQIDLMYNDAFDEDYFKLNINRQKLFYKEALFRESSRAIYNLESDKISNIFNIIYKECISLDNIKNYSKNELIEIKKIILKTINELDINKSYKKPIKTKIKVPEE